MNQSKMLHPVKYAAVIKMSKKFVGKNDIRPILKMVNHQKGGTIIATNSHMALFVENAHNYEDDLLIDPNTLEVLLASYPELLDKVPKEETKTSASFLINKEQLQTWLQVHKSMNQLSKDIGNVHLKFIFGDVIELKMSRGDISFKIPYKDYGNKGGLKSVGYDIENFKNALETMKVFGSDEVKIEFYGEMGPFTLKNGIDTTILISPIRSY